MESAEDTRTIVVVDDDSSVRRAISRTIDHAGFHTIPAASASEAFDILAHSADRVACVLLDIRMPGVTGTEALVELHSRYPVLPIIMVTATNEIETAVDCMRNGAFYYIVKPAERSILVETINKALRFSDTIRANEELQKQNRAYQERLEQMVVDRTRRLRTALLKLKRANIDTVAVLAETIEAKDPYTRGHCGRVRELAVGLARAADIDEAELERLEYGALLHDIGKIGVPEAVLSKNGPLDDGEWKLLQQHTIVGETILSPLEFFSPVLTIVRNHHERFDGTGYPDRLAGDRIDIAARIVTVVDAYDAMTTSRPYRSALAREGALERLEAGADSQFDPELVRVFIEARVFGNVP